MCVEGGPDLLARRGVTEDGGYVGAASRELGLSVVAAGLFEPNVPDFVGGIAGVVTAPARWLRLSRLGGVTKPCLLAVTPDEICAITVRLRMRGIQLGDDVTRWARSDVRVERVDVATWIGHPPPWAALRIVAGDRIVAELKPHGQSPAADAVTDELLRP